MRLVGSALSLTLTMFMNYLLTLLYIEYYLHDVQESFFGIHRGNLVGLWSYFKSVVPSILILSSEMWADEILTIFSRIISISCLDAYVITTNYYIIIQTIAIGLEYSGEILIGHSIGAMNVEEAK